VVFRHGQASIACLAALVASLVAPSVIAQVRLADEADRAAFREWFVLLADAAYYKPVAEVTDCAGLIRYAAREALRPHTAEWLRRTGLPLTPAIAEIRERPVAGLNPRLHKPAPGHVALFRIADDPRAPYAEFADARTLVRFNARFIARDAGALRPGDLLYYQQPSQHTPDHLMVYVGRSPFDPSATDFVVYHTGPGEDGGPGEMRKARLADLMRHPAARWRPVAPNPRFVGIFRLTLS
jgi:uncharacterized protein YfaT (DUF1175 family)